MINKLKLIHYSPEIARILDCESADRWWWEDYIDTTQVEASD